MATSSRVVSWVMLMVNLFLFSLSVFSPGGDFLCC
jgi:hypothetical protein